MEGAEKNYRLNLGRWLCGCPNRMLARSGPIQDGTGLGLRVEADARTGWELARGRVAAPRLCSGSADWVEVVVDHVGGDVLAELPALFVCGAEVESRPDPGVFDLLQRL